MLLPVRMDLVISLMFSSAMIMAKAGSGPGQMISRQFLLSFTPVRSPMVEGISYLIMFLREN